MAMKSSAKPAPEQSSGGMFANLFKGFNVGGSAVKSLPKKAAAP